ncbi:fibronectin type III domain-containing protein [Sulfurimonas sp. HSL1-6]|uniref:fibronectin type III domain-containing protein n=1 Tax=Thiomicrolovo immobilis TaxID=3131935 RepID=UPI0031F77052
MSFSTFGLSAALLSLSLVFSGCGGGGGGSDTPSDSTIPTTPTGLSVQVVSTSQLDLSWNASTDDGTVVGYKIEWGGGLGMAYSTSYAATGLAEATQYCFTVTAIDDEANISPQSAAVCATTETAAPSPWVTVRSGTSDELSNVVWTGSELIAVAEHFGDPTSVFTSSNGIDWTQTKTSGFAFNGADDVVYGNGRFLAVDSDWYHTSTDGITWSLSYVEANSSVNVNALAWSSSLSLYIAVGDSGYIATSADGTSWTPVASVPTAENLAGAAWMDSRFYALGAQGTILTSSNGVDWNSETTPAVSDTIEDIAWNGSTFVAIGYGTVLTSADGNTWNEVNSSIGGEKVVWGGGTANVFVMIGSSNTIYTSPDGTTWARQFPDHDPYYYQLSLRDITWTGTRFAAVGEQGTVLSSANGLDWQLAASGSDLRGVTYDGSRYIAVGAWGRMAVGDSADSLQYRYIGDDQYYTHAIVYNGTQYVAVGQTYGLYTDDLISWTDDWSGATTTHYAVVWDGSQFVRVGAYTQTWDGVSYDSSNEPDWVLTDNAFYRDLFWDGSQFIAVGNSGTVATSPDASTGSWTSHDSNSTQALYGVTKGNGRFIAVGLDSTVITSDDNGTTWTLRYPTESQYIYYNLYAVTWTGAQFVAVGEAGMILTSADGITWEKTYHEAYKTFYDVIANGADIVMVGAEGTIVRNNP